MADLGLRVIVGCKFMKSAVELAAGALLLILPTARIQGALRILALGLGEHATEAWSRALAGVLVRATTPRHIELIAAALVLDGLISAFEGWSLRTGYRWGQWLVILATSAILPFEVVGLVRRFSAWRIVILLANGAIVMYLLHRLVRQASIRRRQT